jgi:hypothetical protein
MTKSGVEDEWRQTFATVSWTAADCFHVLRLEMCSPGSLNHFLSTNEGKLRDAMVDAAVEWLRTTWPKYVLEHGGGSQWLGPTSASTPSP